MKRFLPLFLCLLLLCGCGGEFRPKETETPDATEPAGAQTQPLSFSETENGTSAGEAVRSFQLGTGDWSGIYALSDSLILFSSDANTALLTAVETENTTVIGTRQFSFSLFPEDPCIRRWSSGISLYDPVTRQTLVLDEQLREVSRIPAPEGLTGTPLLSYDRETLYYCTDSALRALDLETGISRVLKEMAHSYQDLSGLLLEDRVVICTVSDGSSWQKLYLSTETGAMLAQRKDGLLVRSSGNRYYVPLTDGSVTVRLFGTEGEEPRVLELPDTDADTWFLPETFSLITADGDPNSTATLSQYDLDSCLRTSQITLEGDFFPWSMTQTKDGLVWFLSYQQTAGTTTLHCWDTSLSPTEDFTFYGGTYVTAEDPDAEGLAKCQAYAEEIGEKYGVEILIHKDAVAAQPWDYDLEPEHLVGVIWRELELLDRNLGNYPDGFLKQVAQRFDGLSICIVRSLTGTAESGSLDTADGVQFLDGYRAYIALAAASNTEYALYHELCHLIDTVVLTESGAYDRWDELNPRDFAYDYDYITNQERDGSAYLQEINRSFIDTYSMSFPKEDRARIMEYAMTEGNESYFRSTTMQSKLKLLCEGIREAFGLRKSPETFLWEQYLNLSLAYKE